MVTGDTGGREQCTHEIALVTGEQVNLNKKKSQSQKLQKYLSCFQVRKTK